MAFVHESLLMVALMDRLMLLRSLSMSYHCTLTVAALFFRKDWLT